MAIHRWPQSASLLLAGLILSLPILGFAGAYHSGVRAIADGVRAEFGYDAGWKIQASKTAVAAASKAPGVTAIEVGSVAVATPDTRVESPLWIMSNDKAPVGILFRGKRAHASGQITLSRHLAETLGVGLDGRVSLHRRDGGDSVARVVGITTDPAERDADLAITVAGDGLFSGDGDHGATYWILPSVPHALDYTPGINASGVSGTVEARLEHIPGALTALGRLTPVVAALALLAMLAGLAVQIPSAQRDVNALRAAGMPLSRCWRVILIWAGVLVAVGSVMGSVAALILLRALADPISSALGQRWIHVSIPTKPLILTAVLPLFFIVLPTQRIARILGWFRPRDRTSRTLNAIAALSGGVLAVVGLATAVVALLQAKGHLSGSHPELLGLFGIVATGIGTHLAASALLVIVSRRPTGRIVSHMVGRTVVGTSIALVIAVAGASYTAWHTHNAYAYSRLNVAPQDAGSYLVYRAPDRAAEQVLDQYRALGGRNTFLYQLPDETNSLLRVTTPGMVSCLGDGPTQSAALDKCFQKLAAIMNFPALDPGLSPESVLAEGDIVDGGGQVGLILYRGSDATDVESTSTVNATATPGLGGNMPGLIVAPDSPIARQYELRPSGLVEFGMLDFSSLTAHEGAKIRALVANVAPAAQVSDATTDSSLESALALSLTAALAAAALALLIQLVTAGSAVSGTRQLRIAVGAIGVAARTQVSISFATVAPALLALIVSGLLARYVGPQLGYPAAGSAGWAWVLPLLCVAVVLLVQAWMSMRRPRR